MLKDHFFIMGVQKCGTTSLHNILDQHPKIGMSDPKEPRFFEISYGRGTDDELRSYEYSWPIPQRQLRGETSTISLMLPWVAERIFMSCENPKFIMIIRDPVERAYSAWKHFYYMRPGRECGFVTAINKNLSGIDLLKFRLESDYIPTLDVGDGTYVRTYVEMGFYYHYLQHWLNTSGKDRSLFHIVTLGDLTRKFTYTMAGICKFLEIESINFTQVIENKSESASSIYDFHPVIARKLISTYAEDAGKLCDFIKHDVIQQWRWYDFLGH